MATPRILTVRDFNTSRFAQLADTSTANIGDILARAESAIEAKMKRPIVPTTFTERFRPTTNTIYLRNRPVISVQSVNRGYSPASVTVPVLDYYVNGTSGIIEFNSLVIGFVVDVAYTAGFAIIPEDLKEAILIQAAYFAFQDLEIYGSGDAKSPGILYLLDDIKSLIAPYRQINIAYTG
jgi:hypothetical protein